MFLGTLNLSSLRSLHLCGVPWDIFDDMGSYNPLIQASMAKLQELSLLLVYDARIQWNGFGSFLASLFSQRLRGFNKLLARSSRWPIRRLTLGLEPFDRHMAHGGPTPDLDSLIANVVFLHHWPHLRSLGLKYLYGGKEHDLFHWLASHRETLRALHIGRIICLDRTKDPNPFLQGCPAFFLKAVAKVMTLDEVSLSEYHFRHQYLTSFRGRDDVEEQVTQWWCEYMCRRAEVPMSITELDHIEQQQARAAAIEAEVELPITEMGAAGDELQ